MNADIKAVIQSPEEDFRDVITDSLETVESTVPVPSGREIVDLDVVPVAFEPIGQAFETVIEKLSSTSYGPTAILAMVVVFGMFLTFSLLLVLVCL